MKNIFKMFKRFLSFVFLSIALWTLSIGLILLFTRQQLLSSDLYKKSFLEADFYNQTVTMLKKHAPALMEDNLKIDEEEEFGPSLMSKFVPTLIEKLELTEIFQLAAEENTENFTDWLQGREDLEIYFPKTALVESYRENVGDEQFFHDFLDTSGFYDLPVCSPGASLDSLSQEGADPFCQNPLIESELQLKIRENFPSGSNNLAEGFLSSMMPELDEKTPVTKVDLTETQAELIQKMPKYAKIPVYFAIALFAISLCSTFISMKLSQNPKLTLVRVFLYSGMLITTVSLLGKVLLRSVSDHLLQRDLPLNSVSLGEELVSEMLNLIRLLIDSILGNYFNSILLVGVALIISAVVLVVGGRAVDRIGTIKSAE